MERTRSAVIERRAAAAAHAQCHINRKEHTSTMSCIIAAEYHSAKHMRECQRECVMHRRGVAKRLLRAKEPLPFVLCFSPRENVVNNFFFFFFSQQMNEVTRSPFYRRVCQRCDNCALQRGARKEESARYRTK